MRLIITSLFLSFSLITFGQTGMTETVKMVFEKDHIDLGTIKKGDVKTFEYIFTNEGKEDIKIDIVSACECSTVDWTRTYVKPGEQGKIEVIFDSTEKEKSETVDVDVDLLNTDPKTGAPIFKRLTFSFKFAE